MKEQWRKFLDENEAIWSYGIVPRLVRQLADAIEVGDLGIVQSSIYALGVQGVVVDEEGNLRFAMELENSSLY